jgi:hypothetical protein
MSSLELSEAVSLFIEDDMACMHIGRSRTMLSRRYASDVMSTASAMQAMLNFTVWGLSMTTTTVDLISEGPWHDTSVQARVPAFEHFSRCTPLYLFREATMSELDFRLRVGAGKQ